MVRSWLVAVMVVVSLAGCAGQPPEESRDGETSNMGEKTGGETTFSEVDRAVLTGVITMLDRGPGEGAVRSILVEESANCGEGSGDPGCEKIYFRITDETRVFRGEGDRRVETTPGDLEKERRVRTDYTGYPLAESYPAQTTARSVVILEDPASSAVEVFFPKQRPVPIVYPDVGARSGELVVDGEGCLRINSVAGFLAVPLWPADFELDANAVPMRVLNGNSKVVAQVGGGTVGQEILQENQVLDERTKRILFERCPEPYFLAAPEGMHIPRNR